MAKEIKINTPIPEVPSLASFALKGAFIDWLNAKNAKKYSTDILISCFDKVSAYAIDKKISPVSLWSYTNVDDFKSVYNKLIGAKTIRITQKRMRKVFIISGQLYLQFLSKHLNLTSTMMNNRPFQSHEVGCKKDIGDIIVSKLDDIVDLEEGKAGICKIVEAHFQTLYGYSNMWIIWSAAQNLLPMFLNDNAINSTDDLWEFMCCAFVDEFFMDKPHIWKVKPNYPQNYVGLVINLARQFEGLISREQIDEYFAKIQLNTIINAIVLRQKLLMFYASRKFILTEIVDLTSERCNQIESALDIIFTNNQISYIIIRDIADEWFSLLPQIRGEYPWTALLLQETLRIKPNIGYNVIYTGMAGQTLDTLGVAIAPEKSSILTFADVAHDFCSKKNLLTKRMSSEELRFMLREASMIEGNELISNLHKALQDHRFAFTDENKIVKILEK